MKSFFKGIAILIFAIIMGCCLGCFSAVWASSQAYLTMPTSVAVFSGEDKSVYESKVEPILKEETKNCSGCSFKNMTPYNSEGKMNLSDLAAQIEAAGSSSSFIYVNWNAKVTDETKPALEALKKISKAGLIIVGSAGLAKEAEPTLPLNKTVLGQVPGAIIIGELGDRERMHVQSFFGPEMLTAIRPPKDYLGQGLVSAFFAAKLATQWNKKPSKDWLSHFLSTKSKVRRIWPDLDDFFGR